MSVAVAGPDDIATADEVKSALERVAEWGIPDAVGARLFDVGTERFLKYFEHEVLDVLVRNGGATCRFFEGQYGTGKTHLVLLLEELGRRRGMAVMRVDLTQAMALEDWQLITAHVLANLEIDLNGATARGVPQILALLRQAAVANVGALASSNLPHSGFQNAMILAASRESPELVQDLLDRYLSGERVGSDALRRFRIRNPLSRRNSEYVLRTVLGGLYRLGVPGVLLVFDENEKTLAAATSRPSRSLVIAANLMRRLIDGAANGSLMGVVVIFAVLTGFIENRSMAYPALAQRLWFSRDGLLAGWRSPVLPVSAVSSVSGRESFLAAVTDRIGQLIQTYGVSADARARLQLAGRRALEQSVGIEFRRRIIKAVAAAALQCIEEGERRGA